MNKKLKIAIIATSVSLAAIGAGVGLSIGLRSYFNDYPLSPKVENNKIHIACIGDSITWGAGVWNKRDKYTYEVLLNNKLGNQYQVLNYGLNGRCLLKEADRPYWNEKFYKVTHDINVENYIVMLGSNDSKPFNWKYAGENATNYKNQLKEFLNSYINLPSHPKVYVMQPPKVYPLDGVIPYEISDDVIKNEIYPAVKEVGDELGITVIDLYTITDNHPEWFPDGVHPIKEGNEAIAEIIFNAINK